MDVLAMAAAERADLADLLESLTPEQWATQSLCAGWTVRDVAAHVVSYEEDRRGDVLRRVVQVRGRLGRLNDVALAPYRDRSPEEIVALLRRHLVPTGTTASLGGRVGLADVLVHHQDVRRPLGLPRAVPADRLRVVLGFAVTAPPLRGFWHARGVRLVADDLDWAWGRGPEAVGPGEAVLMALTGRAGAAAELSGPGRERLLRRLG